MLFRYILLITGKTKTKQKGVKDHMKKVGRPAVSVIKEETPVIQSHRHRVAGDPADGS